MRFLIILLLWSISLAAGAADAARLRQLARDPQWLNLGHYKKKWFIEESQQDAPKFFLSPQGKRSPEAELAATVAAFESQDKSVLCRFPARSGGGLPRRRVAAGARPAGRKESLHRHGTPQRMAGRAGAHPAARMNP
jgi:hypothetical protein